MIISASRRTDIPAFYAEWFMNRIRAGYCDVPNPYSPKQVSRVSLGREHVEAIVFWTRNPGPLMRHLAELDQRGYHYYFLYTVMNNPRSIDPKCPPLKSALKTFYKLADRIGPQRAVWRYDPILFSTITTPQFHEKTFRHIAKSLRGHTGRSIISINNIYRKTRKRLQALTAQGIKLVSPGQTSFGNLMACLAGTARENGMKIYACAEVSNLGKYGIGRGKCIDDEFIKDVFGIEVTHRKDPSQRKSCGCVISKDIGMYESCIYGCTYCYATTSLVQAKMNHQMHNPKRSSLMAT